MRGLQLVKIKNTLIMILVVLYGSHISIPLHLPGSLILSTTIYQHPQVKAPFMLHWMALHMWAMNGKQLVKYQNILTLILLVLDPTQISPYKTWTSEYVGFYTVNTLNEDNTDTGSPYDMNPYMDTLINWCNWGGKLYISRTYSTSKE